MKFLLFTFLLFSQATYSQNTEELKILIDNIIKEASVDKNDKTVLNLLTEFYEETLQSDSGVTSKATNMKIDAFLFIKTSKNKHIMTMFLAYQDYLRHCSMTGAKPDSEFQVYLMDKTEDEVLKIYEKVPAIIYIYKAEAYNSNKQFDEAALIVKNGLERYPSSIPLKVYEYLNTKSPELKADLVKNHSGHWLVQQFRIR